MPAEPSSSGGRLLVEEDGAALILRISNPGRARPTVVAMVSGSSSGEVALAVPASVRP